MATVQVVGATGAARWRRPAAAARGRRLAPGQCHHAGHQGREQHLHVGVHGVGALGRPKGGVAFAGEGVCEPLEALLRLWVR